MILWNQLGVRMDNKKMAGPRKLAQAHGVIIINGEEYFYDELTGLQFKKGEILLLRLKRQWFDMIAKGVKKEEYREMTSYWATRFFEGIKTYPSPNSIGGIGYEPKIKPFKRVRFKNGYGETRPVMDLDLLGIRIGQGNQDWGAEKGKDYFCLELGKIINVWNYD